VYMDETDSSIFLRLAERMKLSEKILERMDELIRQGWCQDEMALDENGKPTDYSNDRAVSWCLTGANRLVLEEVLKEQDSFDAVSFARMVIARVIKKRNPDEEALHIDTESIMCRYNDNETTKKEDILDVIAEALAYVKEEEKFYRTNADSIEKEAQKEEL